LAAPIHAPNDLNLPQNIVDNPRTMSFDTNGAIISNECFKKKERICGQLEVFDQYKLKTGDEIGLGTVQEAIVVLELGLNLCNYASRNKG
jgi:hypothetical protein